MSEAWFVASRKLKFQQWLYWNSCKRTRKFDKAWERAPDNTPLFTSATQSSSANIYSLYRLLYFTLILQILYQALRSPAWTHATSIASVTPYITWHCVGASSQGTSPTKAWSNTWTNVQLSAAQTRNVTWLSSSGTTASWYRVKIIIPAEWSQRCLSIITQGWPMLTGARLMTKFQVIFLVRYLVDDFVIYPFLSLQKSGFQTQKDPK